MRPQNPSALSTSLQLHNSTYKVLRANVSIGSAVTYASDGTPATFSQDNGDGVMVRVAPIANPLALAQAWAGTNTDTTIQHNLGRVPVGYYVTKKSKTCDVFDGTVAATEQAITLQCTDDTADTVLYIF